MGGPERRRRGQLNTLCRRRAAAVARVRPLLDDYSHAVWPLGDDPVRANAVKLAATSPSPL